ncbi:type II toxin-antitoxin system ParD family antitoxin [Algoriphagus sp.]|uniref:type II toxin-antitoxin system ParD family antitoxin n=1 Tax=Algoriphagus sp. TaxID=1872435 RepID=UPI0027285151|nr:type II toxin-antitoxin system ParD family antitoxin [Algoriphagus sp.]MDO8966875.1 type II toxin-antitoxin system ParD family antitoxin [Algoriphagus sp.]MDP3199802.1 type II toxin-antitoxin system ParD family antitoxin [Algoriphagus sp.]
MSTIRKTLTFTDQQDLWIKAQIEGGDFTNESEYIRHLIRQDQDRKSKFQDLKIAIQEGIDSGVSTKSFSDILRNVEVQLKADGKL